MVVLVSSIIAYIVTEVLEKKDALILTGAVEEGLPSWQLPWKFNVVNTSLPCAAARLAEPDSTHNLSSTNPFEMVDDFGIGLFMVALVSILQHLAIAKFYTRKNDFFFKLTRINILINIIGCLQANDS